MLRSTAFAVAAVALAAGCNNAKPAPADVRGCWGTGCAIVTTSHYNPDFSGVGTINAVQMSQIEDRARHRLQPRPRRGAQHLQPTTSSTSSTAPSARCAATTSPSSPSRRRSPPARAEAPNTTSAPFDLLARHGVDEDLRLARRQRRRPRARRPRRDDAQRRRHQVHRACAAAADRPRRQPRARRALLVQRHRSTRCRRATPSPAPASPTPPGRIAVIDEKTDTFSGFIDARRQEPGRHRRRGRRLQQGAGGDLVGPQHRPRRHRRHRARRPDGAHLDAASSRATPIWPGARSRIDEGVVEAVATSASTSTRSRTRRARSSSPRRRWWRGTRRRARSSATPPARPASSTSCSSAPTASSTSASASSTAPTIRPSWRRASTSARPTAR